MSGVRAVCVGEQGVGAYGREELVFRFREALECGAVAWLNGVFFVMGNVQSVA